MPKHNQSLRKSFLMASITALLFLSGCAQQESEEELAQERNRIHAKQASVEMFAVTGQRFYAEAVPASFDIEAHNSDTFPSYETGGVIQTSEQPLSTFSSDVDTAAYSFVRSVLNGGSLPPKNAIRLEEMVNYFDYQYAKPQHQSNPFAVTTAVHDAPWQPERKLIHIGVQGFAHDIVDPPDANLVFLLDVSGSMSAPNKLPLVKRSMMLLLDSLKPSDSVSIVVYAGAAGVVLPPTRVKERFQIEQALKVLEAGGSTAGGAGIELAYSLAASHFNDDGINRVILATDGDFNVGISDIDTLKAFIEEKRNSGIYLSILGFGAGNYQDHLMQTLAQNGNGSAAYIDTIGEAQKVLVQDASSTLFPIATDLKFQIEFNPTVVKEYRLLGYETRALADEDFNNDNVDAGDVGSGHSVTAIYEVSLHDSDGAWVDPRRYGGEQNKPLASQNGELAFLKLRYKLPGNDQSQLLEQPIGATDTLERLSNEIQKDILFATSVAGFAQLLRDAKYTEQWALDEALELAHANRGDDQFGYRSELVQLIRKAQLATPEFN